MGNDTNELDFKKKIKIRFNDILTQIKLNPNTNTIPKLILTLSIEIVDDDDDDDVE